jgi:5-methylthioadenosine/S-adenosylhomocysteine deaminase
VRTFIDAEVTVGLGTDSAASNDDLRLIAEARAAAGDLTPAMRLELATIGGARALGLASVGALTRGFQADMAAFAVADAAACDADPVRYLLEQCGGQPAALTLVAGRVRARGGIAMDVPPDLSERVEQHRARAHAWRHGVAHAESPFLDSIT